MLILWAPGGFRFTCYYYRGAYYKAFLGRSAFLHGGRAAKDYLGERSFPLIVQNIHRYFLYLALLFLIILGARCVGCVLVQRPLRHRRRHSGPAGELRAVDLLHLQLSLLRHLVGGFRDRLAGAPTRKKVYDCVSCLNRRHMVFAWCSLFSVAFADLYMRMCSMGMWTDWRIL